MAASKAPVEQEKASCFARAGKWYEASMCGFKFDSTPGFYGNVRRLASYSPGHMQFGLGWLPLNSVDLMIEHWRPISRSKRDPFFVRWGHVLQMLVAGAITAAVALNWGESQKFAHYAMSIQVMGSSWLTLVSYLLGGFVSLQLANSLRRRLYYIGLLGNWKCLLCLLAGYLRTPPSTADGDGDGQKGKDIEIARKLTHLRATISRYAMLNFEFACLGARGEMDSIRARDFLISKGLCTGEEEWNRMVPGARNHSVVSWVAVLLGKAQDEGFISSSNMVVFNALLERARSNSSNWLDPVLYDVPYQYARLLTSLVKVMILLFAMRFGTGVVDTEGQIDTQMTYLAVVFSMAFNCALQGLVDLHITMYNPFDDHATSIIHETLAYKGLKSLADGLADQANNFDLAYDGKWSATQSEQ